VILNCSTVFGGVEIRVPDNINVQVSGIPLFGGIHNRYTSNIPGAPTLFVNATCIFGGIEIK
jgi:hypothetical protein